MTFIGQVILGAIWAVTLLAVLDSLSAWRRDEPRKSDEQWRNDLFGGRMRARPFIVAAAAVAVVTILIAQGMGGALSSVGGFIAFVAGASAGGGIRRAQLRLVYRTVLGALNEIGATRSKNRQSADVRASGNPTPASQRRGTDKKIKHGRKKKVIRASVPDAAVKAVIDIRRPQPVVVVTMPRQPALRPAATRPPDEQAMLGMHRRNLVLHLKARAAALASTVAKPALAAAPTVPFILPAKVVPPPAPAPSPPPAGSALATQATSALESARARHRLWQAEAAAQREAWRRAGEAQRRQWREEADALRKVWQRPGDAAPKDAVQHPR